jgi:hypothetical protein
MNSHVLIASKKGTDPYDYPDQVIVYSDKFDEYGLIIRDGGTSSYEINFCPFCGSKLPESKRDRWFDELEKLGHENPFDDESIPYAYKSSDWFRRT